MKGIRGLKKKGRNFGRRSKAICVRRLRHASVQTNVQGSRGGGGLRVEDAVVDVDFVRARGGREGGARDCSQRLKSREPLLNLPGFRERGYIHRAKMPSLSSSKLCALNASDLPLKGVSF